jgi:hypothetical protein
MEEHNVPPRPEGPNFFDGSAGVNDFAPTGAIYEPTLENHAPLDIGGDEPNMVPDARAFFEQIMVPELDWTGGEYIPPPPDLTAWMPEVEWLGQLDLFGNNFTPNIDQTFDTQSLMRRIVETPGTVDSSVTALVNERGGESAAGRRHTAFQHSPWYVTALQGRVVRI